MKNISRRARRVSGNETKNLYGLRESVARRFRRCTQKRKKNLYVGVKSVSRRARRERREWGKLICVNPRDLREKLHNLSAKSASEFFRAENAELVATKLKTFMVCVKMFLADFADSCRKEIKTLSFR